MPLARHTTSAPPSMWTATQPGRIRLPRDGICGADYLPIIPASAYVGCLSKLWRARSYLRVVLGPRTGGILHVS